ncbi:MAG: phosphotransferase [Candidatus Magasanikbacteria bacterium]|jgi:Ser/Thr protein kinase RdoA (MazF antagonist)|nr:phosphotransferase [Candidatus Magasanikbacteria bacterium]
MPLFNADNFSNSVISYNDVDCDKNLFNKILNNYFSEYNIKGVSQVNRSEIYSENYKVILQIDGNDKNILLRKYNSLEESQIKFYLLFLKNLQQKGVPVVDVVKTKNDLFYVNVGGSQYAVFDFVESDHFKASEEAFISVARSVAKMHKAFSGVDTEIIKKIDELSQNGEAYFNKIKFYSIKDFNDIEKIINNKKNLSIEDKCVLDKLPLFIETVGLIEKESINLGKLNKGLIHSDLHPHNLLLDGESVKAIIDFDGMRVSQVARDVAFAIYRLGRQFFANGVLSVDKDKGNDLVKLFVGEYEKINLISKEEKRLMPLLVKDEFIRKILFVLNGVYKEDNHTWAKDLPKFLVSIGEINYFWN